MRNLIAAGLTAALATSATAAPVPITTTVSQSTGATILSSPTISDTSANSIAESGSYTTPGVTFDRFDPKTGVLVGATATVNATASLEGVADISSSSFPTRFASGTAGAGLSFTAGSITAVGATMQVSPGCVRSAFVNTCPFTSSTSISDSQTITVGAASPDLAAYLGPGGVVLSRSVTYSANLTSSTAASPSLSATVRMEPGTFALAYAYLLHATPSFSETATQSNLVIDLGDVQRGAQLPATEFNLFNRGDGSTTGLDLDSISVAGDSGRLSSDVSTFAALEAGQWRRFTASLMTDIVGRFSTTYTFLFSDQDYGLGQRQSAMTLTLLGNVIATPEPGAWSLFGIGLLLAGVTRRRGGPLAA